jgi:hypothetical protein
MRVRLLVASAVGLVGMAIAPGVADAHDPIIVTPDQATPDDGPSFPDGTISFAVYGVIEVPAGSAGLRVTFAEGDQVDLSLLIPDLAPENEIAEDSLPTLLVQLPDGTERALTPNTRVPFAEEFSGTNYVRYIDFSEPAIAGEYRLTVFGSVPARFTLSFGTRETFGTPVDNVIDRQGASEGIQTWYRTPPTSEVPAAATDPTSSTAASDTTNEPDTTIADAPQQASAGGGVAVVLGAVLGIAAIVWLLRRRRGTPVAAPPADQSSTE